MGLTGKDLGKAIGFLGAVVLVAVSMIIAGAREPAPAAPSRPMVTSDKPRATPAPADARRAPQDGQMPPDKAEGQHQAAGGPAPMAPSPAEPAPKPKRVASSPASYSRGPLPPFPARVPPLGAQAFPTSTGAGWGGPPPSTLWLSGVVEGDPTVAVLRRGESRYLVKEGDSVEGSYRVTRITANAVTLQRGRHSLKLRLGRS